MSGAHFQEARFDASNDAMIVGFTPERTVSQQRPSWLPPEPHGTPQPERPAWLPLSPRCAFDLETEDAAPECPRPENAATGGE